MTESFRVVRSSSRSPSCASRADTRRDTVDLGRPRRSAAREKLPSSTTPREEEEVVGLEILRGGPSRSRRRADGGAAPCQPRPRQIVAAVEQCYPFSSLPDRPCNKYISSITHPTERTMAILQINSSARGETSHSTRLATRIVERLRGADPEATLTVRDLNVAPHPALDEAALGALFTPRRSAHPGTGGARGAGRCLDCRNKGRRCGRIGRADVQLRGALSAQELDRRDIAGRSDLPLHREGA